MSNTPAEIIKTNLEIMNYLPKEKVKPFSFEQFRTDLPDELVDTPYKFRAKDKEHMKLHNLCYALIMLKKEQINEKRIAFPCPGATMQNQEERKAALNEFIVPVIQKNVERFGKITFRSFWYTLNMAFLEFTDFNLALSKTQEQLNRETSWFSPEEKKRIVMAKDKLMKEIICFCVEYSSTAAAKFLQSQKEALTSVKDFMRELYKQDTVLRFESLKLLLVIFTTRSFELVFKDPSLISDEIKKSYIMQRYWHLKNKEGLLIGLGTQGELEKLQAFFEDPSFDKIRHFSGLFRPVDNTKEGQDFLWSKLYLILNIGEETGESEIRKKSDFVLTCDGLLKIIIILKKLRARLPLILMGETGTGKTYLLKFLASFILPLIFSHREQSQFSDLFYPQVEFEFILVHAGFSESFVVNLIEKRQAEARSKPQKLLIVFLDEFNTANSINLISDLLTKRTFFGRDIPNNLVFVGACNPFVTRVKTDLQIEEEKNMALVIKPRGESKLLYSVNPLTEIELQFLMDFGSMTASQEEAYTMTMIRHNFKELYDEKFIEAVGKCVFFSQSFARNHEGPSSMSIRDIKKFIKAFKWLASVYFPLRQQSDAIRSDPKAEKRIPLLLALWLVYYLRILTPGRRRHYAEQISSQFFMHANIEGKLAETASIEALDMLNTMVLENGISMNTPLQENILSLFICFNAKIPIMICGKPGCSKSLAIHILNENMKGRMSPSYFLKNFPRLILTYFQGSDSARSEGVISAFENSQRIANSHKEGGGGRAENEILVVLVFDELGLAELSPHNPLKSLHGFLDEEEPLTGFAGISNWGLDAAKSNRAVFVARPDLDVNDLCETARSISQTYDVTFNDKYGDIYDALAKTYHSFIKFQMSTSNQVFRIFFC